MRWVEIRRHSERGPDGGLTPRGKRIAQEARNTLRPPYALCYTSPKRRAVETAEAMGFKDPIKDERFSTIPPSILSGYEEEVERLRREKGLTLIRAYMELPELREALKDFGKNTLQALMEIPKRVPEDYGAFIVSHGGTIEPIALVALGREFSLYPIGGEFRECEGVRFLFEGEEWTGLEIIRLNPEVFSPSIL